LANVVRRLLIGVDRRKTRFQMDYSVNVVKEELTFHFISAAAQMAASPLPDDRMSRLEEVGRSASAALFSWPRACDRRGAPLRSGLTGVNGGEPRSG
jgi:hypothetical protein